MPGVDGALPLWGFAFPWVLFDQGYFDGHCPFLWIVSWLWDFNVVALSGMHTTCDALVNEVLSSPYPLSLIQRSSSGTCYYESQGQWCTSEPHVSEASSDDGQVVYTCYCYLDGCYSNHDTIWSFYNCLDESIFVWGHVMKNNSHLCFQTRCL